MTKNIKYKKYMEMQKFQYWKKTIKIKNTKIKILKKIKMKDVKQYAIFDSIIE